LKGIKVEEIEAEADLKVTEPARHESTSVAIPANKSSPLKPTLLPLSGLAVLYLIFITPLVGTGSARDGFGKKGPFCVVREVWPRAVGMASSRTDEKEVQFVN
jgi:hypothetical protein